MLPWAVFLASAAAVVVAGIRLSREGDRIAERTRLGAAFIGTVLVAAATSLPELATTSFAVAQGAVALALGDLFGTLMINMAALALAVLVIARQRVFDNAPRDTAISAGIATALCGVAVVGMAVGGEEAPLGVGWATAGIVALYAGGLWVMRTDRTVAPPDGDEGAAEPSGEPLRPVAVRFLAAAAVIVAAAYALAWSARTLAAQLGVGESFVGAALVGVVTSLPEATVAFAAFMRGAHGLGFGALFGSNAFDVVIVAPLDVIQGAGPILAAPDRGAMVSAIFAMLLMTMAIVGIVAKGDRRVGWIEPVAVAMIATYAVGLFLTYRAGL